MSIKEFINYEIIHTGKYQITVYEIIISVVIILLAILGLRLIKSFFRRLENNNKIDSGASSSIFKIVKYIIWVIIISIVLQTYGIDVTVLVAGSAALFVGLGFGLQNLFNDFASGLIILFERTLKVGDIVEFDGGIVGEVINIGLRTSEIKDRNNIIILVPNSKLVNEKVINWSHFDKTTRFSVKVGVAYDSDVEKVKTLLLQAARSHPKIVNHPEAFVRFSNFGESSLDFELFFWTIDNFIVEHIKSDLRFEINKLFRAHKVIIAFPQLDVHIQHQ
ncbi:MAG: mechanosensitive ion channel [Bacteroidales bacterium]|nr:mechanosensitive ion channel [Bacteroidales bacterium]